MEDHAEPTTCEESTLLELLDRLLNQGVVLCGDLAISVADIEMVYARLQVTLSSVETARRAGWYVPLLHPCAKQPECQHA